MMAVMADMILRKTQTDTRVVIIAPQNKIVADIYQKLLRLHEPEFHKCIMYPRIVQGQDGWPVDNVKEYFTNMSEEYMRSTFDTLRRVDALISLLLPLAESHPTMPYRKALLALLTFRHQYLFLVVYNEQHAVQLQLRKDVRVVVCTSAMWRKILSGESTHKAVARVPHIVLKDECQADGPEQTAADISRARAAILFGDPRQEMTRSHATTETRPARILDSLDLLNPDTLTLHWHSLTTWLSHSRRSLGSAQICYDDTSYRLGHMIAGAVRACLPRRFCFNVGWSAPNTLLVPCIYSCLDGRWSGAAAWYYCRSGHAHSRGSALAPDTEVESAKTPFAMCLLIVVLHMVSSVVWKNPDSPILLVVMWSLKAPLNACAAFVRRWAPVMAREVHYKLMQQESSQYDNVDYWFKDVTGRIQFKPTRSAQGTDSHASIVFLSRRRRDDSSGWHGDQGNDEQFFESLTRSSACCYVLMEDLREEPVSSASGRRQQAYTGRTSRRCCEHLWDHFQDELLCPDSPLWLTRDLRECRFRSAGDLFVPVFSNEWTWLMGMYKYRHQLQNAWVEEWMEMALSHFDADGYDSEENTGVSDRLRVPALKHLMATGHDTVLSDVGRLRGRDSAATDKYQNCRDILREATSRGSDVLGSTEFREVAKAIIPGISATVSGPNGKRPFHAVTITLPMLKNERDKHDEDGFLMCLGQHIHNAFLRKHSGSFDDIVYKVVRHKRDEVLVDGDVFHKRYCVSQRIAASVEVQTDDKTVELLHMYYAMELPYQHDLQTNLLARVQGLEMASIVVAQFLATAKGLSFAMQIAEEPQKRQTELRWAELGGPVPNPHRWVHDDTSRRANLDAADLVMKLLQQGEDAQMYSRCLAGLTKPFAD